MPRVYKPTGRPRGRPKGSGTKAALIPGKLKGYVEERATEIQLANPKLTRQEKKKLKVFESGELEGRLRKIFETQDDWVDRLRDPLKGIASPEEICAADFDEKKRLFIIALGITGLPSIAARAVGFTGTLQLRAAKRLDKEFADDWDHAERTGAEDLLGEVAWVRAVSGTDKPVYFKGELVGQEKVYDNGLLQFLLKAANPDKYGTSGLKVDATVGGTVGVAIIPGSVQSEEDWEASTNRMMNEQRKQIQDFTKQYVDVEYESVDDK